MEGDRELTSFTTPSVAWLTPNAPVSKMSLRRLSCHFRPIRASPPLTPVMARVTLDGFLVDAEEACSASRVIASLSDDEKIAWEFFPPLHRFLIVAMAAAAAAAAGSQKNPRIKQLHQAIEMRDQILHGMQIKLDNLVQKLRSIEDQSRSFKRRCSFDVVELELDAAAKVIHKQQCGHKEIHCDGISDPNMEQLYVQRIDCVDFLATEAVEDNSHGGDRFPLHYVNHLGPEERRMSDLSDWCSTVASIEEHQVTTDQEICDLRKQCDDKDATIKELCARFHASDTANSKRISELEDIIRRKNSTVIKLKKDLFILEQKVLQLTHGRRTSFKNSNPNSPRLPLMATNLVYDLDSSTSPSSSDSDCPEKIDGQESTHKLEVPQPPPASSNSGKCQSSNKIKITSLSSAARRSQSTSSNSFDPASNSCTVPLAAQKLGRPHPRNRPGSMFSMPRKRWV